MELNGLINLSICCSLQSFLVWQLLLSFIFLGRRYSLNQLFGCFLVAVGVIITVARFATQLLSIATLEKLCSSGWKFQAFWDLKASSFISFVVIILLKQTMTVLVLDLAMHFGLVLASMMHSLTPTPPPHPPKKKRKKKVLPKADSHLTVKRVVFYYSTSICVISFSKTLHKICDSPVVRRSGALCFLFLHMPAAQLSIHIINLLLVKLFSIELVHLRNK